VANLSVLGILSLLVAIPVSFIGERAGAQTNAQISMHLYLPCNDEWRQTLQSTATAEDKIRAWSGLKEKCDISGLYEYRLGTLYALAARYDEARSVAQTALSQGTPYEKELLSVLANADMLRENLDASLLDYETLIKKYPDYYDGYAGVGAVKLLQHKFEESIQYLNEAAKRQRTLDIYRNLTIAYSLLGRYEEAVKAINEGYAIDRFIVKDREAMHAAAISYVHLGKLHAADGFLKMLLQADPQAANDPQIHKTMTYVSKKLDEEKLKEATKN
jgi:tetratricopeptide (TPR) repeat protein